jgi:hypothetical protein
VVARLSILAALALGCGCGNGGSAAIDASPVDAGDDGPPDLSLARWVLEPVDGAGDSGFSPAMAFDGSGRAIAVWQLNNASAIGVAIRDQGSWTVDFVSPPGVTGVFSPAVAGGDGAVAHIVFSASTAATGTDIFYTRLDGASLSAATNLTGAGQGASDTDSSPAVAASGDQVTALYSFSANSMGFDRELRALSFTDPASPGSPQTLLDSTNDCGSVRARSDDAGRVHAVAICRPGGGDDAVYVSDRSGSFSSQTADVGSDALGAPDIDVGSDGSVHIVVQGQIDCPEGTCSEPLHSVNLAPGTPVTGGTEDYFSPGLALDAFDRPVILFFDLPDRELYWTFSEGAGFFRPQQVDPVGGKLAGTGADDPETGLPWFVFEERTVTPAIWIARLVP